MKLHKLKYVSKECSRSHFTLPNIKTKIHQDLDTRAHDMELSMSYVVKDMTFVHDPPNGRDKK